VMEKVCVKKQICSFLENEMNIRLISVQVS